MIYVGKRYTSKMSGSVLKGAYCENCQCEYVYRMERTGEGQGSSPYYLDNAGAERRAQEAAARALVNALKGFDAVPCPDCGWYQSNMVSRLGGSYGWLMAMWIIGLMAMLICYAVGLEPFLYSTAITGLFFALWLFLKRSFKPNLRAHERVAKRPRGTPEPILRSVLEPKLKELEEGAQGALQRAFGEIDAAKAKLAGKFKAAPVDPKAQELAESERRRTLRMQLGALGLSSVVAFAVIGPICSWKAEADAYAKITPTNEYAMNTYLREFRNGKHAQEVLDLRDDFHWDTAQSVANSTHTSQSLRAYLSDAQNTRHRDEAKKQIKAMCAAAFKHAEQLPQGRDVDPDFARGLMAVVNSQQNSETPTITVSFEPVYTLEVTSAVRDAEEKSKAELLLKEPSLKAALDRDQSANRIIDSGAAFSEVSTQRRNSILVQRLQEIVDKQMGDHVVSVAEVPKGEQSVAGLVPTSPMIRVKYQVTPAGKLVPLRSNAAMPVNRQQNFAITAAPCGFLRVHRLDWSISFDMKNLDRNRPIEFSTFTFNDDSARGEGVSYVGALEMACFEAYRVMMGKAGLR